MARLSIILLLALIWCGFSASFSLINIISGLIVAIVIYWLISTKDYTNIRFNPLQFIILLLYTVWLLIFSSLEVAWEIVTPQKISDPAIIEVPLACEHRYQILLLTQIISLTPGTLCLGVCEEKNSITIHAMFAKDIHKVIATIKDKLEKKVMKVIQTYKKK